MTGPQLKSYFDGQCARILAQRMSSRFQIDADDFARAVDAAVPHLELKDRVAVIAAELNARLPDDYPEALAVLRTTLGPELQGGTGMFSQSWFLMPVARFVENYGGHDPEASLDFIEDLTRCHTGEFAIRPFLDQHYGLTMARIYQWRESESENIRRLASEGIRIYLPWAAVLARHRQEPERIIDVITPLVTDPSRYVRNSVANNLNDISRVQPQLALDTAQAWLAGAAPPVGGPASPGSRAWPDSPAWPDSRAWPDSPAWPDSRTSTGKKSGAADLFAPHLDRQQWVVRHGLRTLIKQGNPEAFALLGLAPDRDISVETVAITPTRVPIGSTAVLTTTIHNASASDQQVMVRYQIGFRRANGSIRETSFSMGNHTIPAGQSREMSTSFAMVERTTRRLYPGQHTLSIQVNGQPSSPINWELVPAG